MASPDSIRVEIDDGGLNYKEKGTLGWFEEQLDWANVESVSVENVNEVSVSDTENRLPIRLTADVLIGEQGKPDEETSQGTIYDRLLSNEGIAVDIDSGQVSFDPEKSDSENFSNFFKFLVSNGLISDDDLPFQTQKQSNHILNSEPRHPSKEMRRSTEVADGVWLETSIPVDQKKHHVLKAAEHFIE